MGSRPTMQSLQATLELLVTNQVTKAHFDDKINSLEKRVDEQDKAITATKEKVDKITKDMNDMPDNIYQEMHEQELCKQNVIVFGLNESTGNNDKMRHLKDKEVIGHLLNIINDINLISEGDMWYNIRRLGAYDAEADKPRPLKISFNTTVIRDVFLSCCKHLKGKEEWNRVSIVPDLTKVQQKLSKEKRAALQKDANKKNADRKEDQKNKFEFKVHGNYGLGNLRIVKLNIAVSEDEDEE